MKTPRNRKAQDATLIQNDARKADTIHLAITVRRLARRVIELERDVKQLQKATRK